jgi:uncharacterized protein (UPF0333 family)
MEFLLLLGMCVLAVVGVMWIARGRSSNVDDAGLAARANAEAERQKNDWYGGTG